MPKKKSGDGKFEVVVEHPGAVPGKTKGDVITDPSDALIARAKVSSLLTLREVIPKLRRVDTLGGPVGDQEPQHED